MLEIAIEGLHHEKPTGCHGQGLQKLIAVTEPYFALKDINVLTNGIITAQIPIELKNHNEVEGISLSEAIRHMVILGSLALANQNNQKDKHYYLVNHAVFERFHNKPITGDSCQGIVLVDSIDEKEGVVTGKLICNEVIVYSIRVKYAILHERDFKRQFARYYEGNSDQVVGNPYAFQTKFFTEYIEEKSCLATIDLVEKEECAGHFHGYLALPVDRIGGVMIDLSGLHYSYLGDDDIIFCIKKAELHVENLIFAGESVTIETLIEKNSDNKVVSSIAHSTSHQNAVIMRCSFF